MIRKSAILKSMDDLFRQVDIGVKNKKFDALLVFREYNVPQDHNMYEQVLSLRDEMIKITDL